MEDGLHFIAEHPEGSNIWSLHLWKKVAEYPQVVNAQIDQCMAGLIGPKSGLPVRKPTEFWASDELLVRHLRPLQCDGSHKHAYFTASMLMCLKNVRRTWLAGRSHCAVASQMVVERSCAETAKDSRAVLFPS